MAGNPNPNLNSITIQRSLTLTITLLMALFSSAFPSPAPSPSPSSSPSPSPSRSPPKVLMSDPTGVGRPPPLHHSLPSCLSGGMDCPRDPPNHRRSTASPPPPSAGADKLNFGKKIGLTFAAVAVFLQLVFGSFLAYKRFQLRNVEKGFQSVSSS